MSKPERTPRDLDERRWTLIGHPGGDVVVAGDSTAVGEKIDVVPTTAYLQAVQVANEAAALAERYGAAIIAIGEALPDEFRIRLIIAGLSSELGREGGSL